MRICADPPMTETARYTCDLHSIFDPESLVPNPGAPSPIPLSQVTLVATRLSSSLLLSRLFIDYQILNHTLEFSLLGIEEGG